MAVIDDIFGNMFGGGRPKRSRPLRIGVAGDGPELAAVVDAFRAADGVSRIIYFHPDPAAAAKLSKGLNVDGVETELRNFISAVDAAELLGIDGDRWTAAETLLESGVHLSIRKPLPADMDTAMRLQHAARRGDAFLRVDDEALFYEPFIRVKELIDTMEIGELCALRMRANLAGSGGWGPRPELLKDNYLLHPCFDNFALAIELVGDIESVIAYLNPMRQRKGGQGVVCFKCRAPGCYGSLELTFAPGTSIRSGGYPCDFSLEIAGTDGIIWVNHFYGKMTETPWIEVRRGKKHYALGIGSGLELEWADALRASAAHFVSRVAAGLRPKPQMSRHLRALKILLAARESSAAAAEIKV